MWSRSTVDARAKVEQRVSVCTCVRVTVPPAQPTYLSITLYIPAATIYIFIPAAPSLQVLEVLLVVTRVVAPAAHAFARARALAALATMLRTSWLLTEK